MPKKNMPIRILYILPIITDTNSNLTFWKVIPQFSRILLEGQDEGIFGPDQPKLLGHQGWQIALFVSFKECLLKSSNITTEIKER